MADPATLLTYDDDLVAGTIVDRPNRFVVRVRFDSGSSDGESERVYLPDPGELDGIVEPGNEILCTPIDDPGRATAYDAIAVNVGSQCVSVRAALANDLFERMLERDLLPSFSDCSIVRREPPLPDHGRTDFLLESPAGAPVYVEVKSCTSVERGVARFPDRPTERGRRHLRSLESLVSDGTACTIVFVVQRSDAERFRPFDTVDPEFAELLARVHETGVGVQAVTTAFDPTADSPRYALRDPNLPVALDFTAESP